MVRRFQPGAAAGDLGSYTFVRARLPWVKIKVAQGLYINLDGEPLEGDDLHFEALPNALRVHLPLGSPLVVQADDLLTHGK